MKTLISIWLFVLFSLMSSANVEAFNSKKFAEAYFKAWASTQNPTATQDDIEHYLSLLTDDVGHQHLPYDPDGSRSPDGKENMRKGMGYYLGSHTEYSAELIGHTAGYEVVVIQYKSFSKGTHPQTGQVIEQSHLTLEVLEIENGKVSVIRKYSE